MTAQGEWVNLEEGGTVISSYSSLSDKGVLVEVFPEISYYLRLELIQNPLYGRASMLTPPPDPYNVLPPNTTIFKRKVYYSLKEYAPEGDFEFKLSYLPGVDSTYIELLFTGARVKNDYLSFECTGFPQCKGTLYIKTALGDILDSYPALSGSKSAEHPVLPDYKNYYVFEIIDKTLQHKPANKSVFEYCLDLVDGDYPEDNCAFNDKYGNGWAAKLNPWTNVYDPYINKYRNYFEIHPDGGLRGTLGCIGIDPDINTRFFKTIIEEYYFFFGGIRVEVNRN